MNQLLPDQAFLPPFSWRGIWKSARAEAEPGVPKASTSRRILIVDDNEGLRVVLTTYLECEGYDVIQAADGETALTLLNRVPVDLIVLDVMLPGCSGIEVVRAVRRRSRLPILLISAIPQNGEIGLAAGANGFLRKPMRPGELVARVAEMLAQNDDRSRAKASSSEG